MPSRRQLYPPTWEAFSLDIRTNRAQGQCECMGECGLHCTHPGPRRCVERNGQPAVWARGRITLTVAHLCSCEPLCAEPSHCKALCQRCHLRVDIPLHAKHAAEHRRLLKEQQGQLTFLEGPLYGER